MVSTPRIIDKPQVSGMLDSLSLHLTCVRFRGLLFNISQLVSSGRKLELDATNMSYERIELN